MKGRGGTAFRKFLNLSIAPAAFNELTYAYLVRGQMVVLTHSVQHLNMTHYSRVLKFAF